MLRGNLKRGELHGATRKGRKGRRGKGGTRTYNRRRRSRQPLACFSSTPRGAGRWRAPLRLRHYVFAFTPPALTPSPSALLAAAAAALHKVGQQDVAADDVLHGNGVAADDHGALGRVDRDRRLGPALQQLAARACALGWCVWGEGRRWAGRVRRACLGCKGGGGGGAWRSKGERARARQAARGATTIKLTSLRRRHREDGEEGEHLEEDSADGHLVSLLYPCVSLDSSLFWWHCAGW